MRPRLVGVLLVLDVSMVDLREEIRHLDPGRTTGVIPNPNRRIDVVGVDVAIPLPISTDHHDRVAHGTPPLLERRDHVIGRFKEEHHLVAQTTLSLVTRV